MATGFAASDAKHANSRKINYKLSLIYIKFNHTFNLMPCKPISIRLTWHNIFQVTDFRFNLC